VPAGHKGVPCAVAADGASINIDDASAFVKAGKPPVLAPEWKSRALFI